MLLEVFLEVLTMVKDILERIRILKYDDIKPNFADLAKQLGCDYRTIKKLYSFYTSTICY